MLFNNFAKVFVEFRTSFWFISFVSQLIEIVFKLCLLNEAEFSFSSVAIGIYLIFLYFLNFVGNTRKHDQLENALKRY